MIACEFRPDLYSDAQCGKPTAFIWKAVARDIPICEGCAASPYVFMVSTLIPLTPEAERSPLLRGVALKGGAV